jgi:hypothetical protein
LNFELQFLLPVGVPHQRAETVGEEHPPLAKYIMFCGIARGFEME